MALVPVLKPLHLFGIIIFKLSLWNRWEASDWFNVCRTVVGRKLLPEVGDGGRGKLNLYSVLLCCRAGGCSASQSSLEDFGMNRMSLLLMLSF